MAMDGRMQGAVLTLLLLAGSTQLFADERQRLYRSAHYLGRGDTGIAVADDQEALFYNPAGLAQGEGIYKRFIFASPHLEVSKNTRDIYRQIQVEDSDEVETLKKQIGKPQHVGVYSLTALVFRRAAIGALVSSQTNLLVSKSVRARGLEQVDADFTANQVVNFGLAEKFFGELLHVGVVGKYVNRGQAELSASIIDADQLSDLQTDDLVGYGNGTGVDAGIMSKFSGGHKHAPMALNVGVLVQNIGKTVITPSEDTPETEVLDDLVQTLNAGVALTFGTKLSSFKLLADYRDITGAHEDSVFKRTHFGVELNVRNFVGIMGGLNQGYPTGGVFFNTYLLRVDGGFYAEEAGERAGDYPDERYFARITVGI